MGVASDVVMFDTMFILENTHCLNTVGLATRHCDQRFCFVFFGVVIIFFDVLGFYSANSMYIVSLLGILLLKLQNRKDR